MTSHQRSGFVHRILTALGGALQRAILGKSGHDYMKQFAASNEYWDKVIAAQLGWPQKSVRDTARHPAELEFEPVHGWTKRQLDDYLAHNPGYRSTYEAELPKHGYTAVSEVNGSSLDWFGLWRMNHDKTASSTDPKGTKQARESPTDPLCGV